jgi:small subunit ribosomal protein S20
LAKRTKSAVKRARQDLKRRERNRERRLVLKTALKKARTTESKAEAQKLFTEVQSIIDRAARRHIIHPNTARRLKSRISREIALLK